MLWEKHHKGKEYQKIYACSIVQCIQYDWRILYGGSKSRYALAGLVERRRVNVYYQIFFEIIIGSGLVDLDIYLLSDRIVCHYLRNWKIYCSIDSFCSFFGSNLLLPWLAAGHSFDCDIHNSICNFVYRCCNAGLLGAFTKKSSRFDHGMNSIERDVLWDILMGFLKELLKSMIKILLLNCLNCLMKWPAKVQAYICKLYFD